MTKELLKRADQYANEHVLVWVVSATPYLILIHNICPFELPLIMTPMKYIPTEEENTLENIFIKKIQSKVIIKKNTTEVYCLQYHSDLNTINYKPSQSSLFPR